MRLKYNQVRYLIICNSFQNKTPYSKEKLWEEAHKYNVEALIIEKLLALESPI